MSKCHAHHREGKEHFMQLGTHNGKFHADDVFAIAILKQLYPDAQVLRTRNASVLNECDIVVDVGGGPYDHHSTDKVYRDNDIPYASAGLIWRDFGQRVVEQYVSSGETTTLVTRVDEKLMQGIDANDNGYELHKDNRIMSISEIIGGFNPLWNSRQDEDAAFAEAVNMAATILNHQIQLEVSRLKAVHIVKQAYEQRHQKEILVLEHYCPWTETLMNLDDSESVLFVVYPDKFGDYRIQSVPRRLGTFESRKSLPESWAGKEHEDLGGEIGIDDAIFCHPARFIAGAKSKQSIMTMARLAVES
jgi:uncharacterized UPF0160 family protein